jgi:hypothetical protein
MTPFDANLDNDAGHAIDQDDLIAFHLHELSSPQERALRRVLRSNSALQSESLAIASTLRVFPKHEAPLPLDTAAMDRHWQALRNSLPVHIPAAATPFSLFRLPFAAWAFPTLAAVLLAGVGLVLVLRHNQPSQPAILATNTQPTSSGVAIPATPGSTKSFLTTITPPGTITPLSHSHHALLSHSAQQPLAPVATAITSTRLAQPSTPAPTATNSLPESSPAPAITASTKHPSLLPIPSAQTPTSTQLSNVRPAKTHNPHPADITLAVFGNITLGSSTTSGTATYTQTTTPAIGALASFHQQLHPWLGYRITATHSEPTFRYDYQVPTPYSSAPVSTTAGNTVYEHLYEVAGTYVVQGPHRRRISTAAEAGAGFLAFLPPSANIGNPPLINAYRAEAVLGVSAELALTRHVALHAGYRALLYKSPASYYGSSYGVAVPSDPGNLTLSNEPVIGLTYRFHPPRAE